MSDRDAGAEQRPSSRRTHLGMAVGPDRVVAVCLRRTPGGPRLARTAERTVDTGAEGVTYEAALADAVRGVCADLEVRAGSADVALLRPLGGTKVVPLPPLRAEQLRALLSRNIRRYFALDDTPVVVDAQRLAARRSGSLAPALAAYAPQPALDAVVAAVGGAGLRLGEITPASVAAAEAVLALAPAVRKGGVAVVLCAADWMELIFLQNGSPRLFYPLPAGGGAEPSVLEQHIVDALHAATAQGIHTERLLICGEADLPEALRVRLEARQDGPALLRSSAVEVLHPRTLAAVGATLTGADSPALLPDAMRQARAQRSHRRTLVTVAMAAVVLVVAAGLHLWGIHREIDAVQARREMLKPAVSETLKARRAVEGVRTRLDVLAELEREAPRWTDKLGALAEALPDSVYLKGLTADSTGLRLTGVARSAGAVIPALQASPAFAEVFFAAPVRWEMSDATEHFDVSATLVSATVRTRTAAVAEKELS